MRRLMHLQSPVPRSLLLSPRLPSSVLPLAWFNAHDSTETRLRLLDARGLSSMNVMLKNAKASCGGETAADHRELRGSR